VKSALVKPAAAAPGVLLCFALAGAALALAQATATPAVLMALILGFLARPLAVLLSDAAGVAFCTHALLRLGIALIGVRLSFADLANLGWPAVALGVGSVAAMLSLGTIVGRRAGLAPDRAALSAGSVGICGASAALAIAAVLPPTLERERQTVYTIYTVTLLSTAAMLLYPLIVRAAGFSDTQAGMFFGASIHDLTQVIGAGAMISPEATEAATVTKLVRVACLAPAAALIGLSFGARGTTSAARPPLLPWFLLAFLGAALVTNLGLVPPAAVTGLSELATLCLVTATAALGLKTAPKTLLADGWRPATAVLAQTILLAVFALIAIAWIDV